MINQKIIKLINMLYERKSMKTFYVKQESYDIITKEIVTVHSFESFQNGEKIDE